MAKLINIGFGNMVSSSKIVAIVNSDSAPAKRLIGRAKESGMIIDATQGRKTQSVIIADGGQIILSALVPGTISKRFYGDNTEDNQELLEKEYNKETDDENICESDNKSDNNLGDN